MQEWLTTFQFIYSFNILKIFVNFSPHVIALHSGHKNLFVILG